MNHESPQQYQYLVLGTKTVVPGTEHIQYNLVLGVQES
jgi:hypothetical protein